MLDIIRKEEYFAALDKGLADNKDVSLKGVQDGWIMSHLVGVKGKRIMEIGGGNSRVLPKLLGNTLWNLEKFGGVGQGPTVEKKIPGVTNVLAFIGEFSPETPVVDIIFSVSVIEHIAFADYGKAFKDMARCLVPGGTMYHAIDVTIGDAPLDVSKTRAQMLRSAVEEAGLVWEAPPTYSTETKFTCDMASNSDITMWGWGRIAESCLKASPLHQIVSIKLIAHRPS